MTNSIDALRDRLENELDSLALPMIGIAPALMILGDAFDIDPEEFIQSIIASGNGSVSPQFIARHGGKECEVMELMIWEGMDSSSYLPDLLREVQINTELSALDS